GAPGGRGGAGEPRHQSPGWSVRPGAEGGPPRAVAGVPGRRPALRGSGPGNSPPPPLTLRRGTQSLLAVRLGGQPGQADLGGPVGGLVPHARQGEELGAARGRSARTTSSAGGGAESGPAGRPDPGSNEHRGSGPGESVRGRPGQDP